MTEDRNDYITNPFKGETLSIRAIAILKYLRDAWEEDLTKGQIVISDGLNANAIMDDGHLMPYLDELRKLLAEAQVSMGDKNIVVTGDSVWAGERTARPVFR